MGSDTLDRAGLRQELLGMQATLLDALLGMETDYPDDDEGLAHDLTHVWLVQVQEALERMRSAPDVAAALARYETVVAPAMAGEVSA
ncbi:hypothetical protein [Parafrankia sp. FMc2]|uniref:hypothetical protein n=1 Tax=Parafrankia sp. FMc2 TaxID=3233196 RepID=UPI0034D4E011